MSRLTKYASLALTLVTLMTATAGQAREGRYTAHWNGKSYLIVDSENGHLWSYHGNTIMYNGRIDGDEFEPPLAPQIWEQKHGKWSKRP